MTRVSENSSKHSIDFAIGKTKQKLEDLQMRGANMKNIQKPSDDPIGNTEVLFLKSRKSDNDQFLKNSAYAKTQLEFTENALADLEDILLNAKEIAIAQASGVYNEDIRRNVAEEISQLRLQALSIANRRLGNRYIFSGHKTLNKAFDEKGNYLGDDGKITVEIAKDYFIPVNLNGLEVFYGGIDANETLFDPASFGKKKVQESEQIDQVDSVERSLASQKTENEPEYDFRPYEERYELQERMYPGKGKANMFSDLKSFENALATNNPDLVQDLLEKLDDYYNYLVKMRTKIGSLYNSVSTSQSQLDRDIISQEAYRSRIEDADVAELFTDINKQQTVLNATYRTSSKLLNNRLIDFLR
ncbi:MAG: flagellar hook-associated protein FlgL [Halobacteriovoraceae bacterium]|nr:flagellar hook-associated protein FlgL [Halobacteriovoraceae bacterium]